MNVARSDHTETGKEELEFLASNSKHSLIGSAGLSTSIRRTSTRSTLAGEDELKRLQAQNNSLRREVEALAEECELCKTEIASAHAQAEKQLNAKNEEIERLSQHNKAMQRSLESELAAKDAELAKYRRELEEILRWKEDARRENDELRFECARLERALEESTSQLRSADLTRERQDLKYDEELKQLHAQLDKCRAEAVRAKAALSEATEKHEKQLEKCKEEAAKAEAMRKKVKAELEEARAKFDVDLANLRHTNERLTKEIDELQKREKTLLDELDKERKERTAWEAERAALSNELRELRADIELREGEMADLREALKNRQQLFEKLSRKYEEELTEVRAQATKWRTESDRSRAKASDEATKREKAEEQLRLVEGEIAKLEEQYEQRRLNTDNLLEQTKRDVAKLKEQLRESSSRHAIEIRQLKREYELQMEQLSGRIAEAERDLIASNAENDQLRREIDTLTNELHQTKQSLDELPRTYEAEISRLESLYNDAIGREADLQQALAERDNQHERQLAEVARELAQQRERMTRASAVHDAELESAMREKEHAEREVVRAHEREEAARAAAASSEQRLRELMDRCERYKEDMARLREQARALSERWEQEANEQESILADRANRISELEAKLRSTQDELQAQRAEAERLLAEADHKHQQELDNVRKRLEAEIQRLESALGSEHTHAADAIAQRDRFEAECARLRAQLHELEGDLQAEKAHRAELLRDAEERVRAAEERNELWHDEWQSRVKDIQNDAKVRIAQATAECDSLQRELSQLSAELERRKARSESELEQYREQREAAEKRARELAAECEGLRATVERLEREAHARNIELHSLETQRQELERQLTERERERDAALERQRKYDDEMEELEVQVQELCDKYERKLSAQRNEIERLYGQLDQTQQWINTARQEKDQSTSEKEAMVATVESLKKLLDEERTKARTIEARAREQIQAAMALQQQSETKRAQLEDQLAAAKRHLENSEREWAQQREQYERKLGDIRRQAEADAAALRDALSQRETQLTQLKQEYEQLLHNVEALAEQYETRLHDTRSEIKQLRDEVLAQDKTLGILRKRLRTLHQEMLLLVSYELGEDPPGGTSLSSSLSKSDTLASSHLRAHSRDVANSRRSK